MSSSPDLSSTRARTSEREFFGLVTDAQNHTGHFTLTDPFTNPRGSFYGGAGVAVAVSMMEAATERRALWITLQFLGGASRGDRLDCSIEVRAHGKATSQVRVTGFQAGTEIFNGMGATGAPRDDFTSTIQRMPAVRPPDDCPRAEISNGTELERSRFGFTEHRLAVDPAELRETETQAAYWARVPGLTASPALLAYVGDAAAIGVFRALGRDDMSATSLDNTLRFGPQVDTEWMLLDFRAHSIAGGYAHGTVNIWSPDGTLLGSVSQTIVLRFRRPADQNG